jgi:hypothetical protein
MDPISISTAVANLLGLIEKISSILHEVISNVKHARRSAQSALLAVKDMGVALSSIQRLLSNLSALRPRRKSMIELEHLVITVTQAVINLQYLESLLVSHFDSNGFKNTAWERIQWARKEDSIQRAVHRLEGHKSSLSLMLNILQW